MNTMGLADILTSPSEDLGKLRWDVTVPLGTNPFLLLEWLQFSFCGASVVLITLVFGSWLTEGGLYGAEIVPYFSISALVFAALIASFFVLSFLLFKNRYFATYQFDAGGLYYQVTRGSDKRKGLLSLFWKPYPVVGDIVAQKTKSRYIPWEKLTHYQNIASMRVIILRRGFWHMAKVYTPDTATHNKALTLIASYLKSR